MCKRIYAYTHTTTSRASSSQSSGHIRVVPGAASARGGSQSSSPTKPRTSR